jgi:predicted NUDIX family NTP pyrophosphohydrolase
MTRPKVSSGVLLFRRTGGGLEVLLAHPGGPYFNRRDAGNWTIPKGQPDQETDLLVAAAREFEEETGHRLTEVAVPGHDPIPLGTVTLASGKVIHAWAVEGDLDPAAAVSNDFEIEWPPRSGRMERHPEIDRVAWCGPDEARRLLHPVQATLLERLDEYLQSNS